jgi:protein phosphatase
MHVQYAVRSETGLKRSNNEDSYRIELRNRQTPAWNDCFMLFAVADGMGGHPCGEVASMMACDALADFLIRPGKGSGKDLQDELVKIFFYIDEQIRLYTSKNPDCGHMGTTLSVIVLSGEKAVIAHVGDTRIYCLHDEKLRLLTTDHTFVQEMMERGEVTAETAETAPYRNILTQVVGTDEPIEDVYSKTMDISPGDRILLSSDGLHDVVSFQEIEQIMKGGASPEDTAGQLLSQAVAKNGRDDITLIVAHMT